MNDYLIVTFIGRRFSNQYEKEAGKMSWILSSLGITEGAIPFALSDPFRVIPSFMVAGGVEVDACSAKCQWDGLNYSTLSIYNPSILTEFLKLKKDDEIKIKALQCFS
ncbi:hypothetical protein [Spiroplasma endosymbiont of Megaselia nigra]|uniref:hypothetical protein n=1 Tax=Spiroplasma endosymbiont of Megaselia nigra TaxID=2478537 RepID=UPI001F4E3453|nr:hypothetical protein [Spiroplasma endosymbiont of Megaselia nigra]